MIKALWVRNDVLKSLYATTLFKWSEEKVREFWASESLILDQGALTEYQLYRHFWNPGRKSPLEFLNAAFARLEPFLVRLGMPLEEFVDSMGRLGDRGVFLHSNYFFRRIAPLLIKHGSSSPLKTVLAIMETFAKFLNAGIFFSILRTYSEDGKSYAFTMLGATGLDRGEVTPWDGEMFSARLLKMKPLALELPEFQEVALLSDARSCALILGNRSHSTVNGNFQIEGRPFGKIKNFFTFCTGHGLEVHRFDFPSMLGIEIDEDYHCPERRRVVLRKGCFYGAPAYLMRVRLDIPSLKAGNENALPASINPPFAVGDWNRVEARHKELLEKVADGFELEFRVRSADGNAKGDGVIHIIRKVETTLSDLVLCKYTNAKLLRKILNKHMLGHPTGRGATVFSLAEFRHDPEITGHTGAGGLETSLLRLERCLRKSCPMMRIEREPEMKGRFHFVAECGFGFRERQART